MELPEILHADISWPSSGLINLWSWSVDFSNLGAILSAGLNLGFAGIFWRSHKGNGLKFGKMIYLDDPQIWLVYDFSLLIFFGTILT